MAKQRKSSRERFYEKVGIPRDSKDPTSGEDNYFLILGLPEDLSDGEVLARAHSAAQERQRQASHYGHIDRDAAGEFGPLVSRAAAKLSDPAELAKHRQALWQKRLDALKDVARFLKDSGAPEDRARHSLESQAPDLGLAEGEIDRAVSEVMRAMTPWEAARQPPRLAPIAPLNLPRQLVGKVLTQQITLLNQGDQELVCTLTADQRWIRLPRPNYRVVGEQTAIVPVEVDLRNLAPGDHAGVAEGACHRVEHG